MKIKGINRNKVAFDKLHNGDTFIVNNELYIITDVDENEAFCFNDNCKYWFNVGDMVKQVDCEIIVIG